MQNDITNSDRGTASLAAGTMAVVLVLHGLAYFVAPGWLWGANTLAQLLEISVFLSLAIGAVFLLPPVVGRAAALMSAAGGSRVVLFLGDRVVATVLLGGLAAATFWWLGVKDSAATGWLFHSPYPVHSLAAPLAPAAERLGALFGAGPEQVFSGLAAFCGVVLVCFLVLVPFRNAERTRGAAAGLLVAVSGAALVFLTPRADLAFEILATVVFLTLGVAAANGRISTLPAGVAAVCAALVHPIGLALLPALAFILKLRSPSAGCRRGALALLVSAAAVAAVLALLSLSGRPAFGPYISEIKALWGTGSGTQARWVISIAGEGGSVNPLLTAAGWFLERIWGTLNGLLLVGSAGLALAVAGLLTRGWRRAGPAVAFLGLASLVTGVAAFLAAPYLGAPRDWGIYAPAGVCATVFGIWWLMEKIEEKNIFNAVVLSAFVLSLIHLVPSIFLFGDPGAGAGALEVKAASNTPWDVRGRGDTLERLSVFYMAGGDTLAAAGALAYAYEARPNPLYLGTAGSYYAHSRRYDLAEEQFVRLVAARPMDADANLSLGVLLMTRGDLFGATQYLKVAYGDTALTLPEPDIDSRADWESVEKGPEREKFIRARVERRQASSRIFLQGDEASRQGLLDAALKQYQHALRIYPRWGKMQYEVHSHVGTIYAMQGRFKEAAYEFLLAINYFENYPACYYIVNAVGYGPARPSSTVPHARPSAN